MVMKSSIDVDVSKKVPDDSKDGHVLKTGSGWCCQGLLRSRVAGGAPPLPANHCPYCGIFQSFAGPTYFVTSFVAQDRQLAFLFSQCALLNGRKSYEEAGPVQSPLLEGEIPYQPSEAAAGEVHHSKRGQPPCCLHPCVQGDFGCRC